MIPITVLIKYQNKPRVRLREFRNISTVIWQKGSVHYATLNETSSLLAFSTVTFLKFPTFSVDCTHSTMLRLRDITSYVPSLRTIFYELVYQSFFTSALKYSFPFKAKCAINRKFKMATTTDIKIVIVGDQKVGKTCLLETFAYDSFPHGYHPTNFDNYSKSLREKDKDFTLELHDTGGQKDDCDILRCLSYRNTDVFLVAFSLDSRESFDNALNNWLHEVKEFCGKNDKYAQFFLVGLKKDQERLLKISEVVQKAKKSGFMGYKECSSLTKDGVETVFKEIVEVYRRKRLHKSTALKIKLNVLMDTNALNVMEILRTFNKRKATKIISERMNEEEFQKDINVSSIRAKTI